MEVCQMDTISYTVSLTVSLIAREAAIIMNVHGYCGLTISLLTTIHCS